MGRIAPLPNPRLQRTRSALLRSPLSRKPVGDTAKSTLTSRSLSLTAGSLLAFCTVLAPTAFAQDPAASCACDSKAGTLIIRYTPDLTESKWPKALTPVHFMDLLILDKAETTVEGTKSYHFTCRLTSVQYDVTLEPGVANPNLLGRCGAAVTGVISVKRNGAVVLAEQEFETINCHEREKYIKSVTFTGNSSKADLEYATYGE